MPHPVANDRVAAGARFLDKKFPNWPLRVCKHTLNQSSCKLDVLGQLYGDYWVGLGRLKITLQGETQMGFHPITYSSHPDRLKEENLLTEAWKQAIAKRKDKTPVHTHMTDSESDS
jgi:hypothetical protein